MCVLIMQTLNRRVYKMHDVGRHNEVRAGLTLTLRSDRQIWTCKLSVAMQYMAIVINLDTQSNMFT
jgi:hypothetical protein